jgi:hypothetical protein
VKKLLIYVGLWLARMGGLPDPAYNVALMGYARAGVVAWPDIPIDSDDMYRRAYKTAEALSNMSGPELRFAVAREIYARSV